MAMETETTTTTKRVQLNPRNCVLRSTTRPCFTPFYFTAPCQFISLLNLRSLVSGLTPLGCLLIYFSHFYGNTIFELHPFFFQEKTTA